MPHIIGANSTTFIFLAITLVVVYLLPKFLKVIPAPLIAIVILTAVAIFSGAHLKTVGDLGTITQTLPNFFIPNVPFTFETLTIIFPYALALAIVGLLESLLTAQIVDDMTDTESDKNKESRGQGIANVINGFFGGMAGCAMIGQSVINVKPGGRGRLSTFVAGAFLMFLIIVLGPLVVQISMAVLAEIMIVVCIGTFDWGSFKYLVKAPRSDAFVMVATVVIVVWTNDLSKGVIAGVMLSALFFIIKISSVKVIEKGTTYQIEGQLFFASTESFVDYFKNQPLAATAITIDFTNSKIWDESAVVAIMKVEELLK